MRRDWITILSNTTSSEVYIDKDANKEQINGLEALGDVAKDADKSTPMDDETLDSGDETENKEDNPPKEEGEDDTTTGDETNVDTPEEDFGDEGGEFESGLDDNSSDTDVSGSDMGGLEDPKVGDVSKDPHFIHNRRILMSTKLLRLYDSINNSITDISDGPSFESKPVKLDELNLLLENVKAIIESINKEPDYKVVLMKYAVCIKTYNKIVEM